MSLDETKIKAKRLINNLQMTNNIKFTTPEFQEKIMEILSGKAKVVMSDASPSLCGIKSIGYLCSFDWISVVIEILKIIWKKKECLW